MPASSSSAYKQSAETLLAADEPVVPVLPVLGMPVHDLGWNQALALIEQKLTSQQGFTHIAFLNANNANVMVRDPEYREVLGRCLVLPDGIGVDIAAHFIHGGRFRANLNGTDFVPASLTFIAKPLRIGLLGATSQVLQAAAVNFRKHTPWHEFIEISDGYFDRADPALILKRIEMARIDLLLVAMGTPLQEKWVDRHLTADHARVVISVGALLDFVSGRVTRAPGWVRHLRLEWLYRLWLEPNRLWRRYILGIPVFLGHVLSHRLRQPPAPLG
ncbi:MULTISPECIES: WecB/TagA/CpsF family glycosyltransferase [Rhizobiaceae]|uniref:WecB/TagA/CpsF family glycosyltransferase n=1 Tax=Peteryoungia algae TaxID=2919917 RepID=A0ABT0CW33_9HYPH|nr:MULTISPECIES: WecB/TagA/CpsF family glycosyltransferase [unclassified Rhizobium]MCC8931384.1 WecB/TagA/CpsF family glycosyltransferase [Rhizobium sp. 'Codium 1']MCJ8237363.1 WecB/TagA/CpsF family glycosyltransferase [Rhizobium sp. SSM4.3]